MREVVLMHFEAVLNLIKSKADPIMVLAMSNVFSTGKTANGPGE